MELIVKFPKFEGFDNIYLIPSTDFNKVRTYFPQYVIMDILYHNNALYELVMIVIILNLSITGTYGTK